jgi:hypothetical protein
MARDYDTDQETERRESHVTRDRDTIRGWAGEHDATPVRYAGTEGESGRLRIIPETERTEDHEEITWDDFHDEMGEDEVVVYHGEGRREPFEVLDRNAAVGRSGLEDADVEQALIEGETVTTEITETKVVERTIVEEATIESEVVDRTTIEEEYVDAELVSREVEDCEVTDVSAQGAERAMNFDQFDAGHRDSGDLEIDVAVDVDEEWSLTKEVVEQLTIESKIVDTEASETDTVESDTIESSVELAGVQQSILGSDLLDSREVDTDRIVESGAIESEFAEGNTVRSTLYERKTREEDLSVRKRLEGEITDAETSSAETVRSDVVESAIVEDRDFDTTATAVDADVDRESEVGVADTDTAGTTMGDTDDRTADTATVGETDVVEDDDFETGEVVTPTEADEGKDVVDASGEKVGVVAEVDDDTIYVDPHPSLADRIKRALDWGDATEDARPIPVSHVARITDDEVELDEVERFDENERY